MGPFPAETFLEDYKPPVYYLDKVYLKFLLYEDKATVFSSIAVTSRAPGTSPPLVLDGLDLKLVSIKVNGQELKDEDYRLDSRHLTLLSPPSATFTLEIVTEIYPQKNTTLEGLYKTSGNFCTQCEPECFRKITFYQDRPDTLAEYTCRIEANKSLYPVLLSNGNFIEQGDLEDGRHYVLWQDPIKKPCYLFALVAGQFESSIDTFITRSCRKVTLKIWASAQDMPKTAHAMDCLKKVMKWDEDVFGLEYDLDHYNIVIVSDSNMGAMENKGLNIFNSELVLASPWTSCDADYYGISGNISHEYLHNWTGNRVTCRDWFQLCLKEGLTLYRDQEFSSITGSRAVKRIADVLKFRNYQIPQDASPLSHPVRPPSYVKISNLYTVTVYEKGAEVVRMYKTLLGNEGFKKGLDLYLKRHDGQAVTCEDLLAAMEDANNMKFPNFMLWYSQAGTPCLKATSSYDAKARTYSLKFSQEVPPTCGQPVKKPMLIPVAVGLLDSSGKDIPLSSVCQNGVLLQPLASDGQPGYTVVLVVTKEKEEFVFPDIPERPIPSLLRGYSAPVHLESDLSDRDLFFLLAHDSDEYNRWEAGQVLARKLMLNLVSDYQQNIPLVLDSEFVHGIKCILCDPSLDKEYIAKAITLPSVGEIINMMEVADPDAVDAVRFFIRKQLASELKEEFLRVVERNRSSGEYVFDHQNMARRALKNMSLSYLVSHDDDPEIMAIALCEYKNANNMTDQYRVLAVITMKPSQSRDDVLDDFYRQWEDDPSVVNKWFSIQATSDIPGNVKIVRSLLKHRKFDWRDTRKVHALIGGFCQSHVNLHAKDGSGYQFLREVILVLDKINPQLAALIASNFSSWRHYDESRQRLAKAELEKLIESELSENVVEIVSKCLKA